MLVRLKPILRTFSLLPDNFRLLCYEWQLACVVGFPFFSPCCSGHRWIRLAVVFFPSTHNADGSPALFAPASVQDTRKSKAAAWGLAHFETNASCTGTTVFVMSLPGQLIQQLVPLRCSKMVHEALHFIKQKTQRGNLLIPPPALYAPPNSGHKSM